MKKYLPLFISLCLLIIPGARAEALPEETLHALVHEALLAEQHDVYRVELWTEGHHVLGTDIKGDRAYVYLAASVGGYGFFGGGFVDQSGWGGPCTVLLERKDGKWAVDELLEIEDYSEIPSIMPREMEKRYMALEGTDIQEQKRAQARAYLDRIGRTETIYGHTTEVGELRSCSLTAQASNLVMPLRDMYPYAVTTAEYLMDGQRYLYTREWEEDPDAPKEAYRDIDGIRYVFSGTFGTETLIKRRKDGTELERITICAGESGLTVTCVDPYGSIVYAFPMDEKRDYYQPAVTRTGDCRIDTADFDRAWKALPEMVYVEAEYRGECWSGFVDAGVI